MNDLSKPLEYIRHFVSLKAEGMKLIEYLEQKVNWMSREELVDLIDRGIITMNEEQTSADVSIKTSDFIRIKIEDPLKGYIDPATIDISVVYEDEHILAVNKQPGIMVHPAGKTVYGTLINGIHYYCRKKDPDCCPRLLHRLDKNTSGIILVSKTKYGHKKIARTFMRRQIRKTYHALCQGVFKEPEGVIEEPIGSAEGSHIKIKMAVDHEHGKDALTHYRVLKNINGYSLVEACPETGRQHQIRVHLAHIGHPIVGDTMYSAPIGSDKELLWDKTTRFFLHAQSIEVIDCPLFESESMIFSAPYPNDLKTKIESIF